MKNFKEFVNKKFDPHMSLPLDLLAYQFLKQNLFWSSLAVLQFNKVDGGYTPFGLYVTIKTLCQMKFYNKVKHLVSANFELLKYKEIKLVYVQSGFQSETAATECIILDINDELINALKEIAVYNFSCDAKSVHSTINEIVNTINQIPSIDNTSECLRENLRDSNSISLNQLDIIMGNITKVNCDADELLHLGLNSKEHIRKQYFIKAFECSKNNTEPLILLFIESLLTVSEINILVKKIPYLPLKKIMLELINSVKTENFLNFTDHGYVMIHPSSKAQSLEIVSIHNDLICPVAIFSIMNRLFVEVCENKTTDCSALFDLSVRNLDIFNNCSLLYLSLGMFYLLKKKNKESLRYCYKVIEMTPTSGLAFLFGGLVHSRIKETELAVKLLEISYSIMSTSYFPSYQLAYEYQYMNNVSKTKFFYKNVIRILEESIKIKGEQFMTSNVKLDEVDRSNFHIFDILAEDPRAPESTRTVTACFRQQQLKEERLNAAKLSKPNNGHNQIGLDLDKFHSVDKSFEYKQIMAKPIAGKMISNFIYFLIYNENYDEAFMYLDLFKINNLLRVYYYLFTGKITEAKVTMRYCEKNALYYATLGFLFHLEDEFENAARSYQDSLDVSFNQSVESLLGIAQENMSNAKKPNNAFDYTNCLFESLEYKKRII